MPFVSQAQRRWMYANHPKMAKRWEKHTPNKNLPERKRRKVLFQALNNISKKRKGKS